jgi:hypothetical protein
VTRVGAIAPLSTTTNPQPLFPIRASIWDANEVGTRIKAKTDGYERMGLMEREERLAREREEIAARVASFRATQEKFRREREEYFATTLESARHGRGSRRILERTQRWP